MQLHHMIDACIDHFPIPPSSSTARAPSVVLQYKGLYISADQLAGQGICMRADHCRRPVLLLGGTSITLNAQKELIAYLLNAGMEVAAIQTPMGGPLDIGIKPNIVRPLALRDFIARLKANAHIQGLDIVAHSYAAFEVVRTLLQAPEAYRPLVKSIVLINPPGFREIWFVTHLSRIIGRHILRGYAQLLYHRLYAGHLAPNKRIPKAFIRRELHGITAMSVTGLKNPVRSFREIKDIVAFKIAQPLKALIREHGYDIHLFLSADDNIVPVQETLRFANEMLPEHNIKVVPGGHNDILFQPRQREPFVRFLTAIRNRKPLALPDRMGTCAGGGASK